MRITSTPRFPFALAIGFALAGAAGAHEPGPHVHGQASLHVVVDGAKVELQLETPLDNVLGFEHAPRDEQESAAVRAMARRLRHALALFQPTPAARCEVAGVQLASAALAAELLGEQPEPRTHAKEPEAHADLDASFTLRCGAPERLRGLDVVGLMQTFPGMRRLRVEMVGPRGQAAADLQSGRTSLRW